MSIEQVDSENIRADIAKMIGIPAEEISSFVLVVTQTRQYADGMIDERHGVMTNCPTIENLAELVMFGLNSVMMHTDHEGNLPT